jgi:hypothetical protein
LFERARIADDEAAALAAEQRGIGFCQPTGIGDEARRRQKYRAGKVAAEIGLERRDPPGVEDIARDAILPGAFELAGSLRERRLRAKQLQPTVALQQLRNPGFRHQRFVLNQAAADQRQLGHGAPHCELRRGRQIVSQQPGQELRQIRQPVMHLRGPVQGIFQQLPELPREHIGKDGRAFDQPGIAVARFLSGGVVPVHQHDVATPLLQVQGSADAHHPRSQHNHVGLQFRHATLRKFNATHPRLLPDVRHCGSAAQTGGFRPRNQLARRSNSGNMDR